MVTALAVVAVVAVLFAAAVLATRDEPVLADAPPDAPDLALPAEPMTAQDVAQLRFPLALRGYRMEQVDTALERLAAELADRDRRIALLEAAAEGAQSPAAPREATPEDLPVTPPAAVVPEPPAPAAYAPAAPPAPAAPSVPSSAASAPSSAASAPAAPVAPVAPPAPAPPAPPNPPAPTWSGATSIPPLPPVTTAPSAQLPSGTSPEAGPAPHDARSDAPHDARSSAPHDAVDDVPSDVPGDLPPDLPPADLASELTSPSAPDPATPPPNER